MDYILKKYCPRIEFDSYEDFYQNFQINVPEAFNFGFDVVDAIAKVKTGNRGPHGDVPLEPVVITKAEVVEE